MVSPRELTKSHRETPKDRLRQPIKGTLTSSLKVFFVEKTEEVPQTETSDE